MFDELFSAEIKRKINSSAKLILNHATECCHKYSGFDGAWSMIYNKLERAGIDKSNVIFVSGDTNIEKIFLDNNDTSNVIGIDVFELLLMTHTSRLSIDSEYSDVSVDKEKTFLFLNSYPRIHRCILRFFLEDANLLSDAVWSWASPNIKVTKNDVLSFANRFDMLFSSDEIRIICELSNKKHLLDISRDTILDIWSMYTLRNSWLKNTICSLITETNMNVFSKNESMFITEKTYKTIYHNHPFMIYGQNNSLSYLRKLGYCTYTELFDESYDIHNGIQKITTIMQNIQNIKDTTTQQDIKITTEKIKHNRNILLTVNPATTILIDKLLRIL